MKVPLIKPKEQFSYENGCSKHFSGPHGSRQVFQDCGLDFPSKFRRRGRRTSLLTKRVVRSIFRVRVGLGRFRGIPDRIFRPNVGGAAEGPVYLRKRVFQAFFGSAWLSAGFRRFRAGFPALRRGGFPWDKGSPGLRRGRFPWVEGSPGLKRGRFAWVEGSPGLRVPLG